MNKTKIDWCDYTVNPVKGLCKHGCFYCYARGIYNRFKWDKKITFHPEELRKAIDNIKKPSRIFIGSTHDIFGDWIPSKWIQELIDTIKINYHCRHTFIFLTKNPIRYAEFSFPNNCWLGATHTQADFVYLQKIMIGFEMHKNTFLSCEPLLGRIDNMPNCKWIIVGAMTGPSARLYQPNGDWVQNIIAGADRGNIPIFMKDNLKQCIKGKLRQELPHG